jgi:hypothetical protein
MIAVMLMAVVVMLDGINAVMLDSAVPSDTDSNC